MLLLHIAPYTLVKLFHLLPARRSVGKYFETHALEGLTAEFGIPRTDDKLTLS
jgi:hypothetical protein